MNRRWQAIVLLLICLIAATLLDAESSTTSDLMLTITPSSRISKVIHLPLLVNLSGESEPRTAHVQLAGVWR